MKCVKYSHGWFVSALNTNTEIKCSAETREYMKIIDYIAHLLIVIGAINWGLVGFFKFDLVQFIFGDMTLLSRIIFALVGIAGLYAISFFGRIRSGMED